MVTRHKAFRYRVYLTSAQISVLNEWDIALRCLWNLANEQWVTGLGRVHAWRYLADNFLVKRKRHETSVQLAPTVFSQQSELTQLRAAYPQLAAVPRNVCNQLLVELDKAWQRCFEGLAEAPRWKKKGRDKLNFCEPHPKVWRLDVNVRDPKRGLLKFPKFSEPVRVVVHRPLEGTPKTCTLVRDGDQWFASIMCEVTVPEPTPHQGPAIAIDRGITNFAGTSDGKLVPGPQYLKSLLKLLARAQRTMSRRKKGKKGEKGSKNYEKAKRRVMRIHRTIRRQREHFLHFQSSRYTKIHGVIVLEKLNVAGMKRGNCARSISDAGWSMFERLCRYKLEWSGGGVLLVPPQYSSQECFSCEHVDAKSRRGETFCCTKCGHTDHADINAAKVLLRRANRSVLPVEGSLLESARRSRKVESKKLRVPRRSSGASAKLPPLGGG